MLFYNTLVRITDEACGQMLIYCSGIQEANNLNLHEMPMPRTSVREQGICPAAWTVDGGALDYKNLQHKERFTVSVGGEWLGVSPS